MSDMKGVAILLIGLAIYVVGWLQGHYAGVRWMQRNGWHS